MEKLQESKRNSLILLKRLSAPVDGFYKLDDVEDFLSRVPEQSPNPAVKEINSGSQENEEIETAATGLQLVSISISIYLTVFLVALDRTIITTALPSIVNDFKSLIDIGWYASVYLLTAAGFQLAYGKLYTLYSLKWTWWTAILIFEIGSLICALAPVSGVFIFGRAVAGLGSAGIVAGALTVIAYTIPLHKRAAFTGLFGAVFGIASVLGPLLGGAFTTSEHLTWRWCFWINMPLGGLTLFLVGFSNSIPSQSEYHGKTWKQRFMDLDPIGTTLFVAFNVCLFLALQFGGTLFAWNDGRVILLLVLAGVLCLAFAASQYLLRETATLPGRIVANRSIICGMLYAFFSSGAMSVILYFIPLYFQVVQNLNPTQSGILTIPTILSSTIANVIAGVVLTAKLGYYTPFMILGTCLLTAGSAIISTFKVDSAQGLWIGAQILFGTGLGSGMLQPNLAAQNELSPTDVPVGVSLMTFSISIGGAIFVSVAQNVFASTLPAKVIGIPGVPQSSGAILYGGATSLRESIPADQLAKFLAAYTESLQPAFYTAVAVSAASIIGSGLMPWKRVAKR